MLKQVFNGAYDEGTYVLQFTKSIQEQYLCVSYSDRVIRLFRVGVGSLQHFHDLIGHHKAISDHTFSIEESANCFFSSSLDGTILQWDIRVPEKTGSYLREEAFTTLSVNQRFIAAGDESGNIHFWDRRQSTPLKTFKEIHSSSLTQIRFDSSGFLLSASDDGMVSVFDLSTGLDEDESFKAGQNLDPIVDFGFFGGQQEKIWCLTGQNGLVLWNWKEAINEDCSGGESPYFHCPDLRPLLQVESMITCFTSPPSGSLNLAGGNVDGDVGFFAFNEELCAFGDACVQLKQGHTDLVRCCVPWSKDTWITGGEDCKICLWSNPPHINPSDNSLCIKKKEKIRMSPY